MTPKQLETAARNYCLLLGLDPDDLVPHDAEPDENGCVIAVLLHSPRWQLIARCLQKHHRMNEAISAAMEAKP